MNKVLNRKVKGFSGVTHLLLALTLFFLLFLIPIGSLVDFVGLAKSDIKYFLVVMIIIGGASLLPDLDNDESTAGYQLGFIGVVIKTVMKTIAYIIYSFYHLKNDREPKSMHRLFWHTPFVAFLIILYFMFLFPTGKESFVDMITKLFEDKDISLFLINNTSVFILIVVSYACTLLGSNVLLYWPLKLLPISYKIKSLINNIVPIVVMVVVCMMPLDQLRFIGLSIGLGYLFHILGDLISQGSVPVHWPIPYKGKAWNTPWILGPFQIKTGGIVNTILNFVLIGVNVVLLITIFS